MLLLEFVATHLADAPILIVGSYRDVEVAPGHALSATLGGLMRHPHVQRIAVDRLSPAEVTELVDVTPASGRPAGWSRRSSTGPRATRCSSARCSACSTPSAADAPASVDTDRFVPPTIQDVIGRRLGKVRRRAGQVLTVAAVIGRDFDLMTLAGGLSGPGRRDASTRSKRPKRRT